MKPILSITVFLVLAFFTSAQRCPFETSKGKKSATYFEAIKWYRDLARVSPMMRMKEMGPTDAGYPLHLVMISSDGKFDPAYWHRQKKVVILINNGIHPGEPDGIDASMMLARDLVQQKLPLPENVVLAIIPVYNIGGCLNRNSYTRANQNGPEEYGFRGNSQNLDLNRDFTKCDSREARSFSQIFHFLDPDVFIDNHVSDGADYQHVITLITTQYDKSGPVAGKFLKETFEPAIYRGMKTRGWDLVPYVDFENDDVSKGINMFLDPPRYSSGYAALFNTFSFITETHMLKPFEQRVRSTYDLMATFIRESSGKADAIIARRKKAKEESIVQKLFPLSWKPDTSRFSEITFKGYEKGYAKSEATGLDKMYYDHNRPYTRKVKYFDVYQPANSVTAPKAYIIPHGWEEVVSLLKLNGVVVNDLTKDSIMLLSVYHIDQFKSLAKPWEKHHKNYSVAVSVSTMPLKLLKGDHIIYLNQPVNRYIVEMLEPTGDDSFFSWNFFDAVLQQKEWYSDYRWEDVAAGVLKNDAALKEKLEAKKAAEPAFAADSGAILEYIYMHSPYYEAAFLKYPIYRIEY